MAIYIAMHGIPVEQHYVAFAQRPGHQGWLTIDQFGTTDDATGNHQGWFFCLILILVILFVLIIIVF